MARLRFEGDRWMIEFVARFSGVYVKVRLMEYQTEMSGQRLSNRRLAEPPLWRTLPELEQ